MKTDKSRTSITRLVAIALSLMSAFTLTACAPPTYEAPQLPPLPYPKPPDEARFFYERTIRSSADIVVDSEENQFMRYMTGMQRTGVGLTKPFGIAAYGSRVWVSDPGGRRVMMFDAGKRNYKIIGQTQPGMLRRPYDLDTDDAGNLYVIDGTLKTVLIYDSEGNYIKSVGNSADFELASSLAVSNDGSRLYVVDTGGVTSTKHEVMVYDVASGEMLYRFGRRGSGDGALNLPKDIDISPDNRLYVVDSGNFRVNIYEADGTFVDSFGSIGLKWGTFSRPKGIAIDLEGRVYVSDAAFGNFQIFTPDGQLLLFVGERHSRGARGEFFLPSGIDVDDDGRVYMVDQYHKKVEVFRPAALTEAQGSFVMGQASAPQ
ncbi:hypothetical protein [Motiliproteus sediminis]|uniref:hypothetical protein n=1 Tax=Motiliproteus sediminis TaxID=1468178 RepID=UPI001AEFAA10|nr:hypothetical protein [Motiliproteus sediminis]